MRKMKDSGVDWIGEIPVNWELRRIKHLPDPSISNNYIDGDWIESQDISDAGIRYLTTGNIGDGKYKDQGNGYVSQETFDELKCKYAYPGDLVISRLNAPYGRSCILPNDFSEYVLAVDNVILRPLVNRKFLCYVTQCEGYQYAVEDQAKGTTMKRISRTNLGNIILPIPTDEEQNRIVKYLDSICSKLDSIIEGHALIIGKLKDYKTSIITETVTNGLNSNAERIQGNINWIKGYPRHWKAYRVANLYEQTSEPGLEELPILTVSINSGISDRELADDEKDRVFVRSEDRTKYKRVRPGDLAYNMMRAWQGAFGAVRVDGMVSPAYVTCRPKSGVEIDSRYIEYLFRTPIAIEEMHRYSHGIADFRLRLYWPEFKNIRLCLPPIEEQMEIADYIDEKTAKIEATIKMREDTIAKLHEYKKSLIYEVVTGKKEVL